MLEDEKLVVVFQAASGIHLPRSEWNNNIFRQLGKEIGRMHRVTKQYLENETAAAHIKDWYDNEEYNFLKYIPAEETAIREIAKDVLASIRQLPQNKAAYGLVHGDLWLENILVDQDSNVTMIDFQDCEKHYYIYDLVVPVYSAMEYSFAGGGSIRFDRYAYSS